MDFVKDSAPMIQGQGSLNINSDSLTFTQSLSSGLATTVLPVSLLRSFSLSQSASETQRELRAISQQGVDLIKAWEGFRPQMYNDPVGHCTVGYGTLLHTGNCDGRSSEQPFVGGVSEANATQLLAQKAGEFQQIVNDSVTVALSQNQNDALVSFVYNIGGGNFRKSTLLRLLNQGNYGAVPTEMKKWTKARQNGNLVDLPGLVKRRAAEAELFQKSSTGTAQSMSEGVGVRESIVALLDKWTGTTEGVEQVAPGKPLFSEFRTATYLDDQRKAAAKNGRTFTTCVEFMGWILAKGVAEANAKLKVSSYLLNANLWYKEKRATLPQGAWTDYTPGMTERPEPGDIYVLTFAEHVYKKGMPKTDANIKNYRGSFSHIGFVRSIKKNEATQGEPVSEVWEGVDGGAGTAGTYKYDKGTDTFTLQQKGAEKIETSLRTFYPETNIFPAGVMNQDQGPRHLLGWLNVDKIADKVE
jgi:GH24 family phage-related lysozyme (muramidase)